VQGIELDTAFQVTHEWNVTLLYSYSDGKIDQSSQIPCNIGPNSAPVFNTAGVMSFCPGGGSASHLPYWNATLTSEYHHPVANNADGFVRMLFTYNPENRNRVEPNFTVPAYGLLNLYAGVRSEDGAWELSLFAKNALKNHTVLDKSPMDTNLDSYLQPSAQFGYQGSFPSNSG
jgi:iron complex outermembrane receptor protein